MKTRARVNVYELSSYSSCYYVNVLCAYGFELRNRFKQWCSNIIMTTTMMIRCNAAKSKISLSRSFARFAIFQQIDCVLGVCNASAEQRVHTHNDAWQIILQILPHFSSFFMYPLPKNRINSVWYYNVHPSLTVSLSSVHPRKNALSLILLPNPLYIKRIKQ